MFAELWVIARSWATCSVGLVEWIPEDKSAQYQLRNVRYYYQADGLNEPLGDNFDSAFQLEGMVGNGQTLGAPSDTENLTSILEISNTLNEEVKADVSIYSSTGEDSIFEQTYKLKPHQSYHLITDDILQGSRGVAIVKGNKLSSLIVNVMQYGRTESSGLRTAYGIQASESLGSVLQGSYNTFLKQGCRVLLVNASATEEIVTVAMKRYDGTDVELGRLLAVPAHGLTNYNLCAEDQENVYGVVTVTPTTPNTIFATVLRIGENEQYRFPTPVRE